MFPLRRRRENFLFRRKSIHTFVCTRHKKLEISRCREYNKAFVRVRTGPKHSHAPVSANPRAAKQPPWGFPLSRYGREPETGASDALRPVVTKDGGLSWSNPLVCSGFDISAPAPTRREGGQ